MKTQILTLIFVCIFQGIIAQNIELVGEWQIFEFSNTFEGKNNVTDKEALNENNAVWTLAFSEAGEFTQSSNMRTGENEIQEGSWAIEEDNLTLTMNFNGKEITIIYKFSVKNDFLVLTRSNPNKTMILNISFEKSS